LLTRANKPPFVSGSFSQERFSAAFAPAGDSRARAMWRRSLEAAFRTATACAVVAAATLFGPAWVRRRVGFPAFSYVTVILVVTDATAGDAVRGCWLAARATVQGVLPAILVLWLIGPARLNNTTTAAVAAANAFVVAWPENEHVIAKRVALGQIVLVYVIGFINGGATDPVMHPLSLAASTALGAAACVVATVVPYPTTATSEVRENCERYIENACERVTLYVKAFSAEDNTSAKGFISQAHSLNSSANKLLQAIKSNQESMEWERIPIKFLKRSHSTNPGAAMEALETILRGMENALKNCSNFPVGIMNSDLKNDLISLQNKILNLPSLFFISCLNLLCTEPSNVVSTTKNGSKNESFSWMNLNFMINKKRLMPALKCSLSIGFAILFGLIYSKPDGYWSGLPVAISLAPAREATFKVANIKAQGTVLGTVYGVLACFVFKNYVRIRFVSLLPWFILCSFLRQSRMYGQAGGVSAAIGAVLILGRKNFGEPSDFAIARIVETFIGLSCAIMVDVLLQPTRAAVLAKVELSECLNAMHDAVASISLDAASSEMGLKVEKVKSKVCGFGKLIEEAEAEPNFWFLPFNGVCYKKLRASLSTMADFLNFLRDFVRLMDQELKKMEIKDWKEGMEKLQNDVDQFKEGICSRLKLFQEVSLVNSLENLEKEWEKSDDLEKGKSGKMEAIQRLGMGDLDGGVDVVIQSVDSCYLLSLSATLYCIEGLGKEEKEIETGIQELVQWENPSRQVNLNDVLCKIHVLKNSANA
ncbi:uncharacterized protein LOC127255491, partial [Andrographis paniculata]|uniref:uncharacterized protein LOC127255491 n=1 Tax=Andrographis paniculata TaxID=175694 RepID=UPI0021E6F9CA